MDYSPSGSSAALSYLGFPRQEYWSRLPFPSLGDPPEPGIEPGSPALQADALDALPSEPPGKSCRFFEDGYSDWCEVIPHCSFDLHFSNN